MVELAARDGVPPRQRLPVAVLVLAWMQAGCSSSFDDLELATTDPGTPCIKATLPQPPGFGTGGDSIEFVVAVNKLDLGEEDEGDATQRFRSIGFDLDSTCTGLGGNPSCIRPAWATADDTDGPGGRDNAYGALLYRAASEGRGSATLSANSSIDNGLITAVIRVSEFNGVSADSTVKVAVYVATLNGHGTTTATPAWKGEDTWAPYGQYVDPDIDHPKYYADDAFVTDWFLVAHLDFLMIPGGNVLSQAKVIATVVRQGEEWFLADGTITGRLNTDGELQRAGLLKDPATRDPICTNSPSYLFLKRRVCASSDISYSGPDNESAPCDAISMAWKFTAEPARLAGVQHAEVVSDCPPDSSPVSDSCSTLE
jgi:hypothetical protein